MKTQTYPAEKLAPLPPRPMQWRRALRSLARFARRDYDSVAIQEYAAALDGGDSERSFQRFLREPTASALLSRLPDLPARLDDHETLAAMPEGSLARAFLALAERDGIRVRALTESARKLPDYAEILPDPERRWFADRGIAAHDLLHVLTDYGRDEPGESLLLAFSLASFPARVLRISMLLSLLATPKRQWLAFARDMMRARQRGRQSSVSGGTEWEKLLPLPIDEVRRRLGITPLAIAHPQGTWRRRPDRSGWARVPIVLPPAACAAPAA